MKFTFEQELQVAATMMYRFEIEADTKESAIEKAREYLELEAYNDFHPTNEEADPHEEIGSRRVNYLGGDNAPLDKDYGKCIASEDTDDIEL